MPPPNERERLTTLFFYVLVLILSYLTYQLFRPFLVPLGWATVLVVFFYPLYKRLEDRYGRTQAAALSTFIVTVVVIVPSLFVMSAFVRESIRVFDDMRTAFNEGRFDWAERAWNYVRRSDTIGDLGDTADTMTTGAAGFLAAQVGTCRPERPRDSLRPHRHAVRHLLLLPRRRRHRPHHPQRASLSSPPCATG